MLAWILTLALAQATAHAAQQESVNSLEHKILADSLARIENTHLVTEKELATSITKLAASVEKVVAAQDTFAQSLKAQAETTQTVLRIATKAEPVVDDVRFLIWTLIVGGGGGGGAAFLKFGLGALRETKRGNEWLPNRRRDPTVRTRGSDPLNGGV